MGYLFLALALILNACANILLKIGAGHLGRLDAPDLIGRLVTNYHLMAGLVLFALNVVFYIAALSRLNLSVAYPVMTAGGILIVVTVSALYLREPITTTQMLGFLFLVLGIGLVTHRSFT
jgi:multidrug transporter EmrE-like cation transporter